MERQELWSATHENILKRYGEISSVYHHLHTRCHRRYKSRHMSFTLPVVIIGTLSGTANMSMGSFRGNDTAITIVPLIIGGFNLFSAILTTISQFLKLAELSEGHKAAAIAYGKLSRQIRLELSLDRSERSQTGGELVKITDLTLTRLLEQGPNISKQILTSFVKQIEEKPFNLSLPEIIKMTPINLKSVEDQERVSIFESINNLVGTNPNVVVNIDENENVNENFD